MGAQASRGLLLRWEDSAAEEEDDDEEAEATTTAGSGSRQLTELEGGKVSGATAPWSASAAAACSASRVGEEGGEERDFFLLDNSFRRLFFSFCRENRGQKPVGELPGAPAAGGQRAAVTAVALPGKHKPPLK